MSKKSDNLEQLEAEFARLRKWQWFLFLLVYGTFFAVLIGILAKFLK